MRPLVLLLVTITGAFSVNGTTGKPIVGIDNITSATQHKSLLITSGTVWSDHAVIRYIYKANQYQTDAASFQSRRFLYSANSTAYDQKKEITFAASVAESVVVTGLKPATKYNFKFNFMMGGAADSYHDCVLTSSFTTLAVMSIAPQSISFNSTPRFALIIGNTPHLLDGVVSGDKIEVRSLSGRVVANSTATGEGIITVDHLGAGVYIYSVIRGGRTVLSGELIF